MIDTRVLDQITVLFLYQFLHFLAIRYCSAQLTLVDDIHQVHQVTSDDCFLRFVCKAHYQVGGTNQVERRLDEC